jgi:ligand-binding sensor domain-containing protein
MLLTSVLTLALLSYAGGFQEGDWVNYGDFRYISSVAMDLNTVYFGTTDGVIRYDRFANRWLDPLTITDGLPDSHINNIAYDPDYDRLWVSTPLGDAYYQPTAQQWYPGFEFPANLARNDFRPSALGMLTTEFGFTYQNGRLIDINSQSFQLTRGVNDGFDHLYTGTWGTGAVLINPRYGSLRSIPFGLYTDDASALIRIGDKFWIGGGLSEGISPGITLCDTSLQNWSWYPEQYTPGLASTYVTSAVADSNITWLGTDNGLLRFDGESEQFTSLPNFAALPTSYVTSLAVDSTWVYVGTDNGLGYINRMPVEHKKNKKEERAALDGDPQSADSAKVSTKDKTMPSAKNRLQGWYVYKLKVIDNYLYAGSDRGALRRPINSNVDFEKVDTPDNLLSTDIVDIIKSGDSLLFATRNDVVVVDTKSGKSKSLTGLIHFGQWRIRQIAADSQYIWAATDAGLWMYRLSDGYERLFTTADGMISSNVRSLEMIGDYIWMATPNGVIRFYWNRPGRIN